MTLTSSVSSLCHTLAQSKLPHEGAQLPGLQGRAEHAHCLMELGGVEDGGHILRGRGEVVLDLLLD